MKKIVLTGGGTAGHVMPNIALLPYLSGCEIHYIGGSGIEKQLIAEQKGVVYHEIPCVKYVRGKILANLSIPFKLANAVCAAKKVIKDIRPDVIFSKGGYVSLPVAYASGKVPLITHESDISMGLTNKLIKHRCAKVCTSFDVTAQGLKNGIYTGAIIRQELYSGTRHSAYPTLLVMGGSLGSAAINDCLLSCLDTLTQKFTVVHIVGKGKTSGKKIPRYVELEFCSFMADVYADADVIISRGGANSLFEIAALHKKALIIPLPKGASRGDQVENAEYFRRKGLVRVLSQDELTPQRLIAELEKTQSFTPSSLEVDGTKRVAELLLRI